MNIFQCSSLSSCLKVRESIPVGAVYVTCTRLVGQVSALDLSVSNQDELFKHEKELLLFYRSVYPISVLGNRYTPRRTTTPWLS